MFCLLFFFCCCFFYIQVVTELRGQRAKRASGLVSQQNQPLKSEDRSIFFLVFFVFCLKHGSRLMRHLRIRVWIYKYIYMGTTLLYGGGEGADEGEDEEGLTGGQQGYMDFLF